MIGVVILKLHVTFNYFRLQFNREYFLNNFELCDKYDSF